MNIASKLSEIIDELERAVAYENWDTVENCIKELNFLYEDMESSFPMDGFDDDY
jgi:molecular chaperone GrpE (heat shock protein)